MNSFTTFLRLCLTILSPNSSNYIIQEVDTHSYNQEQIRLLQHFESQFHYPFSQDEQFRIQHGKSGDYFSFFKSLGTPYFFVAKPKKSPDEIAAASCFILRTMKTKKGTLKKAWYICDLKVSQEHQGKHLPLVITKTVAPKRFLQCPRGFGICMNPPTGEPKAAKIFKQHGPVINLQTDILNLYTFTQQQANALEINIRKALIKHGYMKPHEKIAYVSTSGMKDYQIFNQHSSRPWNLLHAIVSKKSSSPQADAIHMICSVQGTNLDNDFKKLFGQPSCTAQIVSYGMKDFDFNWLTTNQI